MKIEATKIFTWNQLISRKIWEAEKFLNFHTVVLLVLRCISSQIFVKTYYKPKSCQINKKYKGAISKFFFFPKIWQWNKPLSYLQHHWFEMTEKFIEFLPFVNQFFCYFLPQNTYLLFIFTDNPFWWEKSWKFHFIMLSYPKKINNSGKKFGTFLPFFYWNFNFFSTWFKNNIVFDFHPTIFCTYGINAKETNKKKSSSVFGDHFLMMNDY